jgi:hypothetical protein
MKMMVIKAHFTIKKSAMVLIINDIISKSRAECKKTISNVAFCSTQLISPNNIPYIFRFAEQ